MPLRRDTPRDLLPLSPEDRRCQLAEILATAVVRLNLRAALPTPEEGADSEPDCLEVVPETRLTGHQS